MPYSDFDYTDNRGNNYTTYVNRSNNRGNRRVEIDEETGECIHTPKKWFWEPLLESDGRGYFVRQEHVTPFCGFTGRLLGPSAEEYEAFSSPRPNYDYCSEADFVLDKTA